MGIRYKGGWSREVKILAPEGDELIEYSDVTIINCLSDFEEGEDLAPGQTAEKSCTKLSIKVKIDWNSDDDVFYGVKKLQFHSMNLDPTMMHERLGYWLFNQFEVDAPRSVHAELYINGQFNGIYALVEQIDDRFVKDRFDQEGNLYKEVWPLQFDGTATKDKQIIDALKTNTDNVDISQFKEFADEVEQIKTNYTSLGLYDADDDALIKKWFNKDQLIRTIVVDRAIANDDGVYHWYCGEYYYS